jgi:transcription initiation factor TFIIB
MIAASVYIACRESNIPLVLKDISPATPNLPIKDLGRCVRVMLRYLNLKPQSSDYSSLIYRLGESLRMPMDTRALAVKIMDCARTQGITMGKNPMSIAAAALYIAGIQTNERRTQIEMAEVAKTTPVTIRNRFKDLITVLQLEDLKYQIKRGPSPSLSIHAEA